MELTYGTTKESNTTYENIQKDIQTRIREAKQKELDEKFCEIKIKQI